MSSSFCRAGSTWNGRGATCPCLLGNQDGERSRRCVRAGCSWPTATSFSTARARDWSSRWRFLPNCCSTGDAKITKGYRLPARHVVHTVGPVWSHETSQHAAELLARCYRNCFEKAKKHDLRTIAFPSISTGAYGYPVEPAARIALA